MASAIVSGIALNMFSSAMSDLIKKLYEACRMVRRCDEKGKTLKTLLESMRAGIKIIEKLLRGLLEGHPEREQSYAFFEAWLQRLKTELDAASETVDECFQTSRLKFLKKLSLSKKLTVQTENIKDLHLELRQSTFLINILCLLLKEEEPKASLQGGGTQSFLQWVKEKDDILGREDQSRRAEAAFRAGDGIQHSASYGNHSHHSHHGYPGDGIQHSASYGNHSHHGRHGYPGDGSQYSSFFSIHSHHSQHEYQGYANQYASSGYNNQEISYPLPASPYSNSHYPPLASTTCNPHPQYAPSAPNYN